MELVCSSSRSGKRLRFELGANGECEVCVTPAQANIAWESENKALFPDFGLSRRKDQK